MDEKDLKAEIAKLESVNDQLLSELGYVDSLMRSIGFSEGINTVRMTAEELYEEQEE